MPFPLRGVRAARFCAHAPLGLAMVEEGRVRAAFMPREGIVLPRKPKGGYQLIPVVQLALAWWCYRQKLIRLADLRVWFAAWEMRARRCRRPGPLPRRFALDELRGLTGLSPRRLGESLRRLEAARAAGLVGIRHRLPGLARGRPPARPRRPSGDSSTASPTIAGWLPVPRRILRLLAGGARPALIATVLGHLLRCLYLKQGKCSARGRVKASWIAEAFGVALRRVKEARQRADRHGMADPAGGRPVGAQPLGGPRPHQPGLVAARRASDGAAGRATESRHRRRNWHPLRPSPARNRHPLSQTRNP